ncbi:MAG: MlaE family lipid ABC transporter permease subunit [Deltaproteobacteria bacterium]|nr:MlaE family lipid ABC transporter permease subunit [Deltaproteobacteria bacterium]
MAPTNVRRDTTNEPDAKAYRIARDGDRVLIGGDLSFRDAAGIWGELRTATESPPPAVFDLSEVTAIDGTVMALVAELRADLAAGGVAPEITGATEEIAPLVDLYAGKDDAPKPRRRRARGALDQIGEATLALVEGGKGVLGFVGSMVLALGAMIRRPRSGHLREVPPLVERAGADAVPIVLLINFLVGFVMAYQSARQLKLYGANVFVADLVGISATRELAPLMTAIIVCGRSGAGFAAEIGTMKVNEELDALRTIGLGPFGWLVVPRAIALILVVPLLTLLADFIAIGGGLVVAATSLDVTPRGYLNETLKAVAGWDIATGLLKSVVFAMTITLVSCQQGFAASGGAESVGRRTTGTVVSCLFAIVILDALATVVFRVLGI